jgi:hypothetical protein
MISFPKKARTDKNGTLSLAIATGLPDSDLEVVVVVEPAGQGTAAPVDEWPEGYFDRSFWIASGRRSGTPAARAIAGAPAPPLTIAIPGGRC